MIRHERQFDLYSSDVSYEREMSLKLLAAVRKEDLGELQDLLEDGANPDFYYQLRDGFDGTLLHLTTSGKIAEELLRKGAFVNSRDWCGATPLIQAVRNKSIDVVKVLLHYDASVTAIDGLGENILAIAIKSCDGDTEIIRELIRNGADVNRNFLSCISPLQVAITCNKLEVIDELLKQGASLHQRNDGLTALHYAIKKTSVNFMTIKKLLEAGADCNEELRNFRLNNEDIYHPLDLAILYRKVDTVRELLKYGAKINTQMNARNSLHCVFYSNDCLSIIQELLNNGAKTGSYLDKNIMSPMAQAVSQYMKQSEIPSSIKLMLKYSTLDFLHIYEQYSNDERIIYLDRMADFASQCISEVQDMHKQIIDEKHSLYDYVKKLVNKSLGTIKEESNFKNKIFNIFISKHFPIYGDLIVALMGREFFLYRISFLVSFSSNSKKIVLLPDIAQIILSYLPDSDLLNFTSACFQRNYNVK